MINWFKKLSKNPLPFTLVFFLLAVLFVDYRGEFAVNDDWIFVRQIEAFFRYQYELSEAIDPSFIAQGALGYVWGKFFGVGFESLHLLTIIITFVLIFTVSKVLELLGADGKIHLAVLLLIAFNPLVFSSAFSFMTENYFLLFYALGTLFYLTHFKTTNMRALILGSIFTGLAILVRQTGIVLFIAYLLSAAYFKKLNVKTFIYSVIPIILSFWAFMVWPRYLDYAVTSGGGGLLSNLIELDNIPYRLYMMFLSIPYFAYFSLPLLFYFRNPRKLSLLAKVATFIVILVVTDQIFIKDVFPVGSVFYLEGLHVKSNFRSNLSLLNNIPVKDILSFMLALGIIRAFVLINKFQKLNLPAVFLLLGFLGSFGITMFGNDFYDRYLLPAFLSLILFVVYYFKETIGFKTNFQRIVLVLFILVTVLLQHEFYSHTRLRWKQAIALQWDTGYVNDINVDGTYAKYFAAKKTKNYKGDVSGDPAGKFRCFVQKYTRDTDTPLLFFVEWGEKQFERLVDNPEVFGAKRNRSIPKAKKHLDEFLYNEQYFSPLYNLIGKNTFVGSWCSEEFN